MANNRIFYAVQKVGLRSVTDTSAFTQVLGVQSVGMTTNFNLDQVFEMGQLSIYENIENLPDVEVTMTKVLDGSAPAYCLATKGVAGGYPADPTLNGRSAIQAEMALAIYPDTNTEASGTPTSQVQCSGLYVSNVSYNFPLDDNFTEDLTLVGNHKVWAGDTRIVDPSQGIGFSFTGGLDGTHSPPGTGGVNRRWDLILDTTSQSTDTNGQTADPDCTILPPEIDGISSSGTNNAGTTAYPCHLSNITCSVDLGREAINELGRKGPYYRFVTYPTEVTTEIEVTSASGDLISATEQGILSPVSPGACEDYGNLTEATIRIATCEGLRLYTGLKNKLASVNYTGGDTAGGNVTVTYTYTTFNDFTVLHRADPMAAITGTFDIDDALSDAYLIN